MLVLGLVEKNACHDRTAREEQSLAEATFAVISHIEKSEITIIKTGAVEKADIAVNMHDATPVKTRCKVT